METSEKPFFNAHLPAEDLAEILKRIDENIQKRVAVPDEGLAPSPDFVLEFPASPRVSDLKARIEENKNYHAPLFVSQGWSLSDLIKRVLNIPIKLFARKQAFYNEEVLGMLAQINANIEELSNRFEYDQQLYSAVMDLSRRIDQIDIEKIRKDSGQGTPE